MYGLKSVNEEELEEGMLNPGLSNGENELRWEFIRKVYGILAAQIVLTTIVSSVAVLYSSFIIEFLSRISPLFFFACLPLVLICPFYIYHHKHSLNFVFLGLFTVSLSITVGVECAVTEGIVVVEALILTSAVVSALTGYTFWALRKGKDFSSLVGLSFLFSCFIVPIVTGFIKMSFIPLGPTIVAIYGAGALGTVVFSWYCIYDTDKLIKLFPYDNYTWASTVLYVGFVNMFFPILSSVPGKS